MVAPPTAASCPRCGIPVTGRFCGGCGQALSPPAAAPAPPAPGAPVLPGASMLPPAGPLPPAGNVTWVIGGPDLSVRLRCGDAETSVAWGHHATIGRDPTCTLAVDSPLVSRVHAQIVTGPDGWYLEDAGSQSGTYWDDRRVASQRLSGAMRFWLGPPEVGERLIVVAPGAQLETPEMHEDKIGRRWTWIVGSAATLAVALAIGLFFALRDSGSSGTATAIALDPLKRATVELLYQPDDNHVASGSGTIVDASGLILTNAHVVKPTAVGEDGPDPEFVYVYMADAADQPVRPKYRAHVVANGDGALDLAVLKIDEDAQGNALTAPLHLPTVPLGASDGVRTGDRLWVFGFPTEAIIAGDLRDLTQYEATAEVTQGIVSGVLDGAQWNAGNPDRQFDSGLSNQRVFLNTDAKINHGNSGGLAADAQGRLIGIPTLHAIDTQTGDDIGRLLPVDLAKDLIAQARSSN